ncbi:MAG: TraB/GumN family protein, partial [Cyanobacteria bacterium J06648_11]
RNGTRHLSRLLVAAAIAIAPIRAGVAAPDKAFLWKVESPTNTLYLLGSIHVLQASDYPLAPEMQAAFDDAEHVIFEIDMSAFNDLETQALTLQKAQPDGAEETLTEALSDSTYALAKTKAAELGMPIEAFHAFEPWFFSLALTVTKMQSLGFDPRYGVDLYFFQQAANSDKGIFSLETLDEQLTMLDGLPSANQDQQMRQTLEALDEIDDSMEFMLAAWKTGDADRLEDILFASYQDYPELYERVFSDRNLNWLDTLEDLIGADDDYLAIVGAGHLVGKDGLVNLLRAKGYQVEQ